MKGTSGSIHSDFMEEEKINKVEKPLLIKFSDFEIDLSVGRPVIRINLSRLDYYLDDFVAELIKIEKAVNIIKKSE